MLVGILKSFFTYFYRKLFTKLPSQKDGTVKSVSLQPNFSGKTSYKVVLGNEYKYCFISSFFSLFFFYFILLYNTLLVLPYINMNLPQVYTCSPSWTPLPPPFPYHLSGSSQCTSPRHPVSIEPRLAIRFLHDIIHVSMPTGAYNTDWSKPERKTPI